MVRLCELMPGEKEEVRFHKTETRWMAPNLSDWQTISRLRIQYTEDQGRDDSKRRLPHLDFGENNAIRAAIHIEAYTGRGIV